MSMITMRTGFVLQWNNGGLSPPTCVSQGPSRKSSRKQSARADFDSETWTFSASGALAAFNTAIEAMLPLP